MHNLRNRSKDKKGFTLAELLIVVAIIAVLVAIAIPVFTGQLEKAREAADIANIRAAYAEACLDAIENGGATGVAETVAMVSNGAIETEATIGGKAINGTTVEAGKTITVTVTAATGEPEFAITTP
ncbi:MAG: prepilin-type N-terminal cleavage/methylation domain-containing protein [Peptococcaceae bacterium]|nr:prepilin-type N-terminal cleavage/methylation domain-containing protein [Peptococcaceae bacterium]